MNPSGRRLAIVGTGLMGGSLGLAFRKTGLFDVVQGYDSNAGVLESALGRGAINKASVTAAEAVREADLVFIATPVEAIPKVFSEIAPYLAEGTIVSDLGSTKTEIVARIAPLVPVAIHFIGGHPIAGGEQEGIDAADADLYQGCIWILTPDEGTDTSAYGSLVRALGQLGARVLSLNPARHDELVALTSHLPQLLSSALMKFSAEVASEEGGLPLVGAGGFRDMTRIAASSPDMWIEILRSNQDAVSSVLARFEVALASTREALKTGDWDNLRLWLSEARNARSAVGGKPGLEAFELIELTVPVPDRPGVLAEITTTVGEAGINIEDIDIVHSAEGGRGTVRLSVNGSDAADRAAEVISRKGYRVNRVKEGA